MVLGIRLAERLGLGEEREHDGLIQHWLGGLIGHETTSEILESGDEWDDDDEPTPWLVERLTDLLLLLFGPAILVIFSLMMLFRMLAGR